MKPQRNTVKKFDDWLFYLMMAININPRPNEYIRAEAKAAKSNWKRGKKLETPGVKHDVKALRVINMLIRADKPAELLGDCVSEASFKEDVQ